MSLEGRHEVTEVKVEGIIGWDKSNKVSEMKV